jgi:glycosyltransferase involved in cell wall biosynthesis
LINFATLKTGGGQNVALNFLYAFEAQPLKDVKCYFLVAKNSEPHLYLQKNGSQQYIVAPRNALKRILFELFLGWYFLRKYKIDIVYSYFGYAWFPRRWPQVSGSADSNLYFPEIVFWSGYRGLNRLKKALVDRYRLFGLKRSIAVVFENAALEERGRRLYGLKQTQVIKPSICFNNNRVEFNLNIPGGRRVKRGLFLCGWHLNKNIMLIPSLAAELRRLGRPFVFILTAPSNGSMLHKQFCDQVRKLQVDDMVCVTGPVHKDQLSSLYDQIDYVFLLSKLESFSNNIIEAWYFRKPLLISDEPWARSICKDAAVYVDRDSVTDIAEKLCALMDGGDLYQLKVERGAAMLDDYPNIERRVHQEIDYVGQVLKGA